MARMDVPKAAKESGEIRRVVESYFNPDAVRETVVRIARTPCPQTELYERDPLILKAIQTFFRPAFEEAGCSTWIDDYGNLIATQGEGGAGRKILLLSYAMAWTEGNAGIEWIAVALGFTGYTGP